MDSFGPFICVSKVLGLASVRSRSSLIWSSFVAIATTSFSMGVLISSPVAFLYTDGGFKSCDRILIITDTFEAYVSSLSMALCYFLNIFNRKKLVEILDGFERFDRGLGVDMKKHWDRFKRISEISMLATFLYFVMYTLLEIFTFDDTESPAHIVMYIVPCLTNSFVVVQFLLIETALKNRIRLTNDSMRTTGFRPIRYRKISEQNSNIVQYFSKQILAIVVQSLVTLISTAFFLVSGLITDFKFNLLEFFYTLIVCFYCIFQLVAIVVGASFTSQEWKRATQLVFLTHHKSRKIFNTFQLKHEEISFDLCKGYPINATMLTAILGTITTYLVIVIQFQVNGETARS